jgi:hypothetical protein
MRRALASKRLPHALLLRGPSGVGKRTAARALAAAALCREPAGGDEACGACLSCRELAARVHPDFHEPDVDSDARTITVDLVRGLIAGMNLRAARGGRKVALVPVAERIQEVTQNTLLKTLEEPAGESLWILTCEDPSALLPTVRSRATDVRFGRVPAAVMAEALRGEHSATADGSTELAEVRARAVAGAAEGSFTRAKELLSEDLDEERGFLRESILPGIGGGARAGPGLARDLLGRVKAAGKKTKRKRAKRIAETGGHGDEKGSAEDATKARAPLEDARRRALRMLETLSLLLRDRMRECLPATPARADFWARGLEVVLESDAAIRQNVTMELALAVAAARLARVGRGTGRSD